MAKGSRFKKFYKNHSLQRININYFVQIVIGLKEQ